MPYTIDMNIAEIVDSHPKAKDVLMDFGLPCYRCIVAYHETLAEGVKPHDLDAQIIVERLNRDAPRNDSKKT